MDGYIGEIRLFAGTFAPMNWAFCQGQLLSIQQYTALYSILGTQFGGNGTTNFNLPDLQGRVPVGSGNGSGLTPRANGQKGGAETIPLSTANLPAHQHSVVASNQPATVGSPSVTAAPSAPPRGTTQNIYSNTLDGTLPPTGSVGSNQAHENMPPWCGMNYIICLNGTYPPRD